MSQKKEMSFLHHLEALRWHLIRGFSAIIILSIVAFFFKDILFDQIILAPSKPTFWTNRWLCHLGEQLNLTSLCINQNPVVIKNISMSGQFTTHVWVSFIAGIIISFPYVFFEIWRFISPALHENEAKHTRGAIIIVSLLFFVGVLFGYYVIAPMSIDFLISYQVSPDIANEVTLSSYISTISSIVFSAGVMFELPVFIFILAKIGIVSSSFLKKYRRHAIVVIFTIAAIITPPDVFSQVLVSIPMILLYEVSILIAKRMERKKARMAA